MNVNGTRNSVVNSPAQQEGIKPNQQGNSGIDGMFLQLLIAQIQNQDPTNPTDSSEYVNQMAQMAQVQSMETMKALMQNNARLMDNLQMLSTSGLVGKQVMVQTDQLALSGESINGRLTLQHPSSNVMVMVKDFTGAEHKIELGEQSKGTVDFTIAPTELGLADGKYTLTVVTDAGEEKIPLEVAGVVSNVRIPLEGGGALLNIPGLGEVPYNKVSQFGGTGSLNSNSKFA